MADKKIILITGGNTGLGLEIVRALAKTSTPYEIIIGCRTPAKGEEAISTVKAESPNTASAFSIILVDLESDASLEAAVKELESKHGKLDILVNNGGASFGQAGNLSIRDTYNKSWDVNVTGTHVLTTLAVPLLLKSSDPRLIFITSGTSSITETDPEKYPFLARINTAPPAGWPKAPEVFGIASYRSAKAGLNMLMREWHRALKNDGVKVWCISPGYLATGLGGVGKEKLLAMGALEPHIGGEFVRDVVEGLRDGDVGLVIRNKGVIQPW